MQIKRFLVMSLFAVVAAGAAYADGGDSRFDRNDDRDIERRMNQLERRVSDMQRMINHLQRRIDEMSPMPNPQPPVELTYACILVDSGYNKTFLGIGRNVIDAEFAVRNACQGNVNASYCTSSAAKLKCDDNSRNPYQTYTCIVTDSGYGKMFKGDGRTAVEAEAKAKQSCQNSVNASYCGNVAARCQAG